MLPSLHRLSLATTGADDDESELVEAVGGLQLMDLPNEVLGIVKHLSDPKELSKLACQDVLRWCASHQAACNDPTVFRNALALFGLRTDVALTPPFPNWTVKYTFTILCDLWSRTGWWHAYVLQTPRRVRDDKFRLRSAIPAAFDTTHTPHTSSSISAAAVAALETSSVIIGPSAYTGWFWDTLVSNDYAEIQLRYRLRQPSCPLRDLYWARSCYAQIPNGSNGLQNLFDWWIGNRIIAKCEELGIPPDFEIYSDEEQHTRWLNQDRALQAAVFSIDDAYWNENAWATHDGWATVRRLLNEGANPFWDPKRIANGGSGDEGGEALQNEERRSVFQQTLIRALRDDPPFSLVDAILDVAGSHVVQGWGLTILNYSKHDDRALMLFSALMAPPRNVPYSSTNAGGRHRTLKMLNDLLSDGADMLYEFARGEFGTHVNPYRNVYHCHVNDQGEVDCTHAESEGPIQWLLRQLYATLVGVEARWPEEFRRAMNFTREPPRVVVEAWQTLHDEMLPQYEAVVAKVRAIEAQAYQTWQEANAPQPGNP